MPQGWGHRLHVAGGASGASCGVSKVDSCLLGMHGPSQLESDESVVDLASIMVGGVHRKHVTCQHHTAVPSLRSRSPMGEYAIMTTACMNGHCECMMHSHSLSMLRCPWRTSFPCSCHCVLVKWGDQSWVPAIEALPR